MNVGPLLVAMQAAGMVIDWFGSEDQAEKAEEAAELQRIGIEANIRQNRLETEDSSLQALKNLRKNLGSQAALFAARGTRQGAGSAMTFMSESISNFNSDERVRRINAFNTEVALMSGINISHLNQQANNSQIWQGFAQRSLNRIPTNPKTWDYLGKSFGLTQKE